MRNSFQWPLSQLLLLCLALALLAARPAKADQFDIFGSAFNGSGMPLGSCAAGATCSFSGTLTVDVAAGTLGGVDITFPGLLAFDTVEASGPQPRPPFFWEVDATNSSGDSMTAVFTTTPTPGSLVGFEGGTIVLQQSSVFHLTIPFYIFNGSITPVPEPSTIFMVFTGLAATFVIYRLRRRRRDS